MNDDQELSLASISQFLRRHRMLVGIAALLGALLIGIRSFMTPPYFRAETSVTEVRDKGMANVSSLASQLGGLASLAGVNIPAGGAAGNQEFAAVLESNRLTAEFIKRNDLIPVLLRESSKPPTMWRAVRYFRENVLTIRRDKLKGLTTITMEWQDAKIAARWANDYVMLANELLRDRAIDESSRNIAYLNREMGKTDSVDLRKVMYSIIENETKTLMVANGRIDYAYEVVDPAVPPELKAGPHRLLNTLIGLVLGFVLGSGIAFVVESVGARRGQQPALARGV
ncbi:MAG: hypothetical protein JSR66_14665 [Proteobacteria bacterium]|nr:hypothetical protein [Pseudomonadota bacterium]